MGTPVKMKTITGKPGKNHDRRRKAEKSQEPRANRHTQTDGHALLKRNRPARRLCWFRFGSAKLDKRQKGESIYRGVGTTKKEVVVMENTGKNKKKIHGVSSH